MKKHQTSNLLLQLAQTIKQNINDFKSLKDKGIIIRDNLYLNIRGKINDYTEGIRVMEWKRNIVVKKDYQLFYFFQYLTKLSEKYPIIEEVISSIEIDYDLSKDKCKAKLSAFIKQLVFEETKPLSDNRIIELTTLFNNDLINHPPDWNVKLFITGLWLIDDVIKINDKLTIRKPVDSDYHQMIEAIPISYDFNREPDMCDSIFELTYRSISKKEIQQDIEKLTSALSYYNLGNVQVIRFEEKPNSIIEIESFYNNPNIKDKRWKYGISESQKNDITQFIILFLQLIPPRNWAETVNHKNAVYTAMERYKDALFNYQIIESRITNVITALEALFLKVQERSELSHKLSQRTSFLLSKFGYHPLKAYKTLHRAYEIRSTYIHGALMKPDEKKDFSKIEKEIIEYCRICIIYFLELTQKFEKDSILTKIDNSILDIKASQKFVETINELKLMKLTAHNKV